MAGGAGGLCHCVRVSALRRRVFADGLNDEGGAALAFAGFGELGDGAVDAKGHPLSRPR